MSEIATLSPAPEFLSYAVTQLFDAKDLRLGVITSSGAVSSTLHLTNRAAVIAAEFNGSGWLRPSIVIPGLGAYDTVGNDWDLPSAMSWSVTAPTGGIDIKQFFVIIGGSTTPRDTTGTLIGLATLSSVISVPAGVTTSINAPWSLLGVA